MKLLKYATEYTHTELHLRYPNFSIFCGVAHHRNFRSCFNINKRVHTTSIYSYSKHCIDPLSTVLVVGL